MTLSYIAADVYYLLTIFVTIITSSSSSSSSISSTSSPTCSIKNLLGEAKLPEFLYFDSKEDKLLIVASLNVHQSVKNPLECGSISASGVQEVEAFMFALDLINNHQQLLPGVELGALILDSCSSHPKITRDISNFLSSFLMTDAVNQPKLPSPEQVVGFIIEGDNEKMIDSVLELTSPLDLTTIAPHSRSSKYNNINSLNQLLRLSTPNDVFADAIVSILVRFSWSHVSVIYDSTQQMNDVFNELKTKCKFLGIEFAMEELMKSEEVYANEMVNLMHRLKKKAKQGGAKVVILLLGQTQIRRILSAAKKLSESHQFDYGELLWLTLDSKEVFHDFPEQSFGALTLQQQSAPLSAFKNQFLSLSLVNNTRDPWYRQYWEDKYNCVVGMTCQDQVRENSAFVNIFKETTQTMNALFAYANGLELVRRTLCPEQRRGLCSNMKAHPKLSKLVFEAIRRSTFVGADGRQIMFDTSDSGYAFNPLTISNLRHFTKSLGSITSLAWLTVGKFSPHHGLAINLTKARAYLSDGQDVPLTEIKSTCTDAHSCSIHETPSGRTMKLTDVTSMNIPASSGSISSSAPSFTLGAIMSIHSKRIGSVIDDSLACSGSIDLSQFMTLIAFNYAIDMLNFNTTVLGIQDTLGGIILDDCGLEELAQQRLIQYLAHSSLPSNSNIKMSSKSLISIISFGETNTMIDDILDAHKIVHLNMIGSSIGDQKTSISLTSSSDSSLISYHMMSLVEVIVQMRWNMINLIYSPDGREKIFLKKVRDKNVCVENMVGLRDEISMREVDTLLEEKIVRSKSRVIVLLTTNKKTARILMNAIKQNSNMGSKFVILGGEILYEIMNEVINNISMVESDRPSSSPSQATINAIVLKTQSNLDEQFITYFSSLSLEHHASIPSSWIKQFWQQHFECQLEDGSNIGMDTQGSYDRKCSGHEQLSWKNINLDVSQLSLIESTIQLVRSIEIALQDYLSKHCLPASQISDIDECGEQARHELQQYIMNQIKEYNFIKHNNMIYAAIDFQIIATINGSPFTNVGQIGWKNNGFKSIINTNKLMLFKAECDQHDTQCILQCQKLLLAKDIDSHSSDQELLSSNDKSKTTAIHFGHLRSPSGVITGLLSGLGIILVLISSFYFSLIFPITVGTTVLTFQILAGLLLSYSINFVFLLPINITMCWLREFGLSLAWALIITAFLGKVIYTWRLMDRSGQTAVSLEKKRLYFSSSSGLVFISASLILLQIIISLTSLYHFPAHPKLHEGIWQCMSSSLSPSILSSTMILIVKPVSMSLLYIIFLLLLTILFSCLTWKGLSQNREPRLIMSCCLAMILIWTLIYSWHEMSHDEDDCMSIVFSNLATAWFILCLLFIPKLYSFHCEQDKLGGETDLNGQQQLRQLNQGHRGGISATHRLYGAFKTNRHCGMKWNSNADPKSMKRKKDGRRDPFEADNDDCVSSCGSVKSTGSTQVTGHDLYPIDVFESAYDGGSQFAPVSSTSIGINHGQSKTSLYGMIDDTCFR